MSQLTHTKHQVPRFCFPLLVTLLTILVIGIAGATAGATAGAERPGPPPSD